MKVKYIGASHRKGVSAKTNTSYSIARLAYAIPLEPAKTDLWTFVGCGSLIREIEIEPSAIHDFNDVELGEVVELVLEPNPNNPSSTLVVGLNR